MGRSSRFCKRGLAFRIMSFGARTVVEKQNAGKKARRDVAVSEPVHAIDGPAMAALSEKQRAYVTALFEIGPAHGAGVRALKMAGIKTPSESPQSMARLAWRIKNDDRVILAIEEVGRKLFRGLMIPAVSGAREMIADKRGKDRARAIAFVLDRSMPLETTQTVKVQHDVTPGLKETAEIMERIAALAQKFGVSLPTPVILDNEPNHADR